MGSVPEAPTLADLDALPPGVKGEIIEGVLYTTPRSRGRHQHASTAIGSGIQPPFGFGDGPRVGTTSS